MVFLRNIGGRTFEMVEDGGDERKEGCPGILTSVAILTKRESIAATRKPGRRSHFHHPCMAISMTGSLTYFCPVKKISRLILAR